MVGQVIENKAAPGISYFTPAQTPPAGTAVDPQPDGKPIPKLFQPLKLRGLTLPNRIVLSPLCQYSADNGHATPWHMAHLGGIISRGPGLSFVEATAVEARGRISPQDVGLWQDSQIEPLRQVVEFAHSQNQKIAIQLGHGGRKASTVAPWLAGGALAAPSVGGWPDDVVGPSAIPWNEQHAPVKAMTLDDIAAFKANFGAAVSRALAAGFDAIEIHNAHGYLLHSFLSPVSNARTDHYGGSWDNRTRLTREVVELTRALLPADMPLLLRISATDFLEESQPDTPSWRVEDTVRLAPILADLGVDLLDVSGGGNHPAQHPHAGEAYQAPFAKAIKQAVGDRLAVGTVGSLLSATTAEKQLEDGLDAAFVGRGFQKNPGLVWAWADELDVEVKVCAVLSCL
ncbi:hypothetical protein FH972_023278 [Carpinus fangiana]|uniref:NADH:flavin oxidoreductase/NADH oxidase N-terminal domain-containing protein n=1 Tax=Carpinus fangiana TaxID=176857 RepID=A0A5N6KUZ8_9ROSI|nr:hypothetical protein FH972_023278 [Carpinus fangiana]